ncbi:type I-E CRISPR-associated endonuclease Cas1e [Candidatus Palauibacter sp.]|uniref:type I-E CRISPR-associated endonuclease Cas1e n=1 Tax=Candidatus Palauibacter sp. TaxID=3101350 RepID=UPI003AF21AAB
MLIGRLGLDTARIPHADRHGLLWLSRGELTVRDGTLSFERAEAASPSNALEAGRYTIPFQSVSMILLGPGSTVSHDALRLLARHGTALAAVGVDGVRMYTAPPLISGRSGLARLQAQCWADKDARLNTARRMYAWRLGEVFPHHSISALRGMEGARMRETYRLIAQQVGIEWRGRRYDRKRPGAADLPNQALNHASSAVEAAAAVAVAATATIPQLGFVHEDPSQSFVLDIADLFRDSVLIPAAFRAAKKASRGAYADIERLARKETGETLSRTRTISKMITRIKDLFPEDSGGH